MIPRTRTPYDKLTVAELFNIFLIDMFISVFPTCTDAEWDSCPNASRIKYFDITVYNILIQKWLHAPVMGRLSNFINGILEYTDVKGLHVLVRGGLNIAGLLVAHSLSVTFSARTSI
jgi:hypothetical protein